MPRSTGDARPLIAITGARARASRVSGMPELLLGGIVDLHHAPYAHAVAAAGGTPIQIPREVQPAALLERLDGLVLSGGEDVDPRLYGHRPGAHTTQLDPERDAIELQLIEVALEIDLPLLAICRGCQLLNVARGGTLVAHLPLDEGEAHGQLAYPLHARVHGLEIVADELLDGLLDAGVRVNSFHHQAVAELGDGVVAAAFAPDGVLEAITVGRRALGAQWHPEYLREQPDPIFAWLVDEARRTRTRMWKEHLDVISA
jgi:putative glutamine amidotransferase